MCFQQRTGMSNLFDLPGDGELFDISPGDQPNSTVTWPHAAASPSSMACFVTMRKTSAPAVVP